MAVYKNDANLQALWLFNNSLLDDTSKNNDLTDHNTVGFNSGDKQEGSHSLDLEKDNSEYASITDADQTGLDITGDITICAWIKLESSAGTCPIINKDYDSTYRFEIDGSGNIAKARLNAGATTGEAIGATALSNTTWYHVAFVYNGTDIRIYVNGSLDSNGASNPKTYSAGIQDTAGDVRIGKRWSAYFDGRIDELAVFNRALSATEINDIHTNGIQDAPTGIVPLRRRIEGY